MEALPGRFRSRSVYYVRKPRPPRCPAHDALAFGLIPVIRGSEDPGEALRAYVRLYLKEEIQGEALTRNLPGFAHFLPVAALFHGQALNVSAVARDAGAARTTVQGYFQILEDTLFTFTVPAYEAKLRVRERRHPKLYWVDPGLVRAVRGDRGAPDAVARGALFEGWMAQCLARSVIFRG